ncbi:MAG: methylated-DNA--[protein]-cysteine S-methyltransferase [Chloroflexi bacterium]|nr:methylated-DNA--[protein]-cysteine S-methyltransferase [Chloroflexota bacterium]
MDFIQSGRAILTTRLDTPLGPMLAGATGQGVCLLEFADSGRAEVQLRRLASRLGAASAPGESPFFAALRIQLDEYFTGLRRHFSLPLVLAGTPFQLRVWIAVQAIPYGETRTYRALAAQIGSSDAARAVGSANGANPLAILVPCHRLTGADGKLTGYGGGLWRKRRLLELERSG